MSVDGIPNGWRLVRVGRVCHGETRIDSNGNPLKWSGLAPSRLKNLVIIEPIKDSKQYREPELSDLSNGPIEIEACTPDPHTGERRWRKRKLVAIQTGGSKPFVVQHPNQPGLVVCYKEARIEVVASSEASPTDHIAEADKMLPPTGYRLLDKSAKVEPRKAGDLFWSASIDDWVELAEFAVEYANRDDWPACRKIETANTSETPNSSIPDPGPGYRLLSKDPPERVVEGDEFLDLHGEWIESMNWRASNVQCSAYYRRKIETVSPTDHIADANKMVPLAIPDGWRELNEGELLSMHDLFDFEGEWTRCKYDPIGDRYSSRVHKRHIRKIEQAPQDEQVPDVKVTIYREPTQADLANGPIRCRVRDSKEDRWLDRDLHAVMPETVIGRFVTISEDKRNVGSWMYCEIKSDHQAIRVGDLVRVTARPIGVYREGWRHEMNRQVNKVARVSGITDDGRFLLNGCGGWRFHRDWLELVETASEAKGGGV